MCASNMCESTRAYVSVIALIHAKEIWDYGCVYVYVCVFVSVWWGGRVYRGRNNLSAQKWGMRDPVNVQICSIEDAANHMS